MHMREWSRISGWISWRVKVDYGKELGKIRRSAYEVDFPPPEVILTAELMSSFLGPLPDPFATSRP
jgi:hypothetical protein